MHSVHTRHEQESIIIIIITIICSLSTLNFVIVMRCPRSVLARLVKFWMAIEGEVTDNFLQLFSRFLLFMIRLHLFVGKLAGPLKSLFLVASVRKQLQIKR